MEKVFDIPTLDNTSIDLIFKDFLYHEICANMVTEQVLDKFFEPFFKLNGVLEHPMSVLHNSISDIIDSRYAYLTIMGKAFITNFLENQLGNYNKNDISYFAGVLIGYYLRYKNHISRIYNKYGYFQTINDLVCIKDIFIEPPIKNDFPILAFRIHSVVARHHYPELFLLILSNVGLTNDIFQERIQLKYEFEINKIKTVRDVRNNIQRRR